MFYTIVVLFCFRIYSINTAYEVYKQPSVNIRKISNLFLDLLALD